MRSAIPGNHLRIPNAQVFKATILNYARNPERRFNFELGIDADDDPLAAIQTGVQAMDALDFVLKEPPPLGIIRQVGDSNIVIFYAAWMNQRNADFMKSRSLAIAAVKDALETNGFGLPEPIYRLRFDQSAAGLLTAPRDTTAAPERPTRTPKQARIQPQAQDVKPGHHIDDKVAHERREGHEQDLLNESAPTE
ncbi:MAG: mechanosensitive ion channel [Thiogranum sp.]|nr:mechanosensitive ion channel [Thiogranum sp.]